MKVSKTNFALFGGLFALLVIASCARTHHGGSNVYVKPPFKNVQVATNTYDIDPVKGGTIKLENGTHIIVPANAFTDASGNPVKEKVSLQYREFRNNAEVMASGIPMNYDSGGQHINFESAGMFDINGSCNNQPVKITAGKKIEVQMASFKDGAQYNFYRYDTKNNNWECNGNAKPQENVEKKEALAKIEEEKSKLVAPKEVNSSKLVLNLDVDYSLYPELKAFDGVLWQYAGSDPAKDPEKYSKTLTASTWSNVQLKQNEENPGTYFLGLDCGKKHFDMEVAPVLRGKDLAKAKQKFDKEMANYVKIETSMVEERTRIKNEANLLRTFQVSNFGIYNWDCAMSQPGVVMALASFKFDQDVEMNRITVYLISGEARRLVTYYPGDYDKFSFNPNTRNCLVAVMPNDKLAIFGSDEFSKIRSWKKGDPINFALKTMNKKVKDVDDLNHILESI